MRLIDFDNEEDFRAALARGDKELERDIKKEIALEVTRQVEGGERCTYDTEPEVFDVSDEIEHLVSRPGLDPADVLGSLGVR